MSQREQYYLVRKDVLSESMLKVLEAKELLETGKARSVTEAVRMVDLSRSAYYKYKDGILPFQKIIKERVVTLFFHLEDRAGILKSLLNILSEANCNVLTIHQSIPLQGRANVSLSMDTTSINLSLSDLIEQLERLIGVEKVDIVGTGGI
ncbi:chorismate mutase [Pullulanibacillus pueri]|uniref:UPF0735 ACT domain-containing protein GCM10007096_32090 n=1 Tax=Pullulanibacillus pueri TaxID=1437324 RepID=A0A8J2ZYC7_9BACL|nr:ACT domain-containing protein [Pullulanibacillus pueri]MBM7683280.1 chorismate mutase [Pullulanibacillus pueri]GGH85817.1 UPF0735 ACT domain-containing protein YszB [Pullulanibacillus pueri]